MNRNGPWKIETAAAAAAHPASLRRQADQLRQLARAVPDGKVVESANELADRLEARARRSAG